MRIWQDSNGLCASLAPLPLRGPHKAEACVQNLATQKQASQQPSDQVVATPTSLQYVLEFLRQAHLRRSPVQTRMNPKHEKKSFPTVPVTTHFSSSLRLFC